MAADAARAARRRLRRVLLDGAAPGRGRTGRRVQRAGPVRYGDRGVHRPAAGGRDPVPMNVRFGIVGAGAIGRLHASVIAGKVPGAELVAVTDRTMDRAAALAGTYGARAYPSLDAALDRVDAVAVCTPSGAHADAAVAALNAGRHVLIEKPIDVTIAAAERIITAQRRAGTVASVVSQHRFDPASQAVYRAVRAGRLGRMTSAVVSM